MAEPEEGSMHRILVGAAGSRRLHKEGLWRAFQIQPLQRTGRRKTQPPRRHGVGSCLTGDAEESGLKRQNWADVASQF